MASGMKTVCAAAEPQSAAEAKAGTAQAEAEAGTIATGTTSNS